MIDRHEQPLFHRIRQQTLDIGPPALQFDMVVFGYSIHAGMHLRAARHRAGDFFAQEEVGMMAQLFHGVDRIMIGYRDKIHSPALKSLVKRARIVVRLSANAREHGHCTHTRMDRMDVEVAPHDYVVTPGPLQNGD